MALALIAAAALATFAALLITSRPYDPMNSTIAPQESVPPAPIAVEASPKPSPSAAATVAAAAAETAAPPNEPSPPDDAEIKSALERALAADAALSNADITTMVENGRVTLLGSVDSVELKQKADKLAHGIKGVNGVNNQLIVTQTTPGPPSQI